jgi:cell wall-associated NlpC family hydrolase
MCAVITAFVVPGWASAQPTTTTTSAPSDAQIQGTKAQVQTVEAEVAKEEQQTAVLDQRYDVASQRVMDLRAALAATANQLALTKETLQVDRSNLARDAVNAYIYDTPEMASSALFTSPADKADVRSEYEDTLVGDMTQAANALVSEQSRLTSEETLQVVEAGQAQSAATSAHALAVANANATAATEAVLANIKGTLAQQVAEAAEAEAEKEAAAAAAAKSQAQAQADANAAENAAGVASQIGGPSAGAAATTAANQAAASAGSTPSGDVQNGGSGSSAGQTALRAAESQLGVPYVYGGESPGQGFDCSGLTQWSWEQAGVDIPRVAADQYADLPHVSLSDLEPGDLLFYYNLDGDDTIDHVVMWVGNGPDGPQTIIQAPYTGTDVSYAPLYTDGLVGAAQP